MRFTAFSRPEPLPAARLTEEDEKVIVESLAASLKLSPVDIELDNSQRYLTVRADKSRKKELMDGLQALGLGGPKEIVERIKLVIAADPSVFMAKCFEDPGNFASLLKSIKADHSFSSALKDNEFHFIIAACNRDWIIERLSKLGIRKLKEEVAMDTQVQLIYLVDRADLQSKFGPSSALHEKTGP